MPDSSLLLVISNAGIAGVFAILFLLGYVYPRVVVTDLKAEIAELKAALEAERDRANAAITAAAGAKDVIAAIQAGLQLGAQQHAATRRREA